MSIVKEVERSDVEPQKTARAHTRWVPRRGARVSWVGKNRARASGSVRHDTCHDAVHAVSGRADGLWRQAQESGHVEESWEFRTQPYGLISQQQQLLLLCCEAVAGFPIPETHSRSRKRRAQCPVRGPSARPSARIAMQTRAWPRIPPHSRHSPIPARPPTPTRSRPLASRHQPCAH